MSEIAWLREMERNVRLAEAMPDTLERGTLGLMPKGTKDWDTSARHRFLADWYETRGYFYRRAGLDAPP